LQYLLSKYANYLLSRCRQLEMLRFEIEVKSMRKDYQQLFRLFFMTFVLNSVTALVCMAEERQDFRPAEDIISAHVLRNHELYIISIMGQQPSSTFNYQGFTVSVWGSDDAKPYPAETVNHLGNHNQTDFVLAYFKNIGIFQLGGGYINYSISPIFSETPEPLDFKKIFVMFGLDTILSPTLTLSKEFNNYNYSQWSAILNISHTYEFNKNVSMKSYASAGYTKRDDMPFVQNYDGLIMTMIERDDNYYDGMVSVSLPIRVSDTFSIIPTFTYAFPFNSDSRHDIRSKGIVSPFDKSSSFVYGGLSMSYSF
jgi:hypothetical protein